MLYECTCVETWNQFIIEKIVLMYRELKPCRTVELHASVSECFKKTVKLFLRSFKRFSLKKKHTECDLKPFRKCFQKNCFVYCWYIRLSNIQKFTKHMLQVERDIKNDFMCRCRYCTMVCKKRERENIIADGCSAPLSGPIKIFLYWTFCESFLIVIVQTTEMHYITPLFFFSPAWQNRRRVFISLRNGSISIT